MARLVDVEKQDRRRNERCGAGGGRWGWGCGGGKGGSEVAEWSADACEQFQYDRLRENITHVALLVKQ